MRLLATVPAGDGRTPALLHLATTSAGKSSIIGPGAVFATLIVNGHKMIRQGERKAPGFLATQDMGAELRLEARGDEMEAAARDGKSYEPPAGEADGETAAPGPLASSPPRRRRRLAGAGGEGHGPRVPRPQSSAVRCRLCKTARSRRGEHAGGWWAVAVDLEQLVHRCEELVRVTITNVPRR